MAAGELGQRSFLLEVRLDVVSLESHFGLSTKQVSEQLGILNKRHSVPSGSFVEFTPSELTWGPGVFVWILAWGLETRLGFLNRKTPSLEEAVFPGRARIQTNRHSSLVAGLSQQQKRQGRALVPAVVNSIWEF